MEVLAMEAPRVKGWEGEESRVIQVEGEQILVVEDARAEGGRERGGQDRRARAMGDRVRARGTRHQS